jgi:hypothetical protein
MYSLHIFEYGTLKPIKIILRRGRERERTKLGCIVCIHGNVIMKPPVQLYTIKNLKKRNETSSKVYEMDHCLK